MCSVFCFLANISCREWMTVGGRKQQSGWEARFTCGLFWNSTTSMVIDYFVVNVVFILRILEFYYVSLSQVELGGRRNLGIKKYVCAKLMEVPTHRVRICALLLWVLITHFAGRQVAHSHTCESDFKWVAMLCLGGCSYYFPFARILFYTPRLIYGHCTSARSWYCCWA